MKFKLLILYLFFAFASFGQKLPTTNLCLSDVLAVTGGTCLADAFTNANPAYFDPTYAVSGNCLDDFRNYGPTPCQRPGGLTTADIWQSVSRYDGTWHPENFYLNGFTAASQALYDFVYKPSPYTNVTIGGQPGQSYSFAVGDTLYYETLTNCQKYPDGYYLKVLTSYPQNVYHVVNGKIVDVTMASIITTPTLTTSSITNITSTTASGGGNITSDGGASVTARGVCWNTATDPTTTNSHTTDGTGTGSFTSSITGLSRATTYYVRAYATNSQGTAYGSNINFTTLAELPTVSSDSYSITNLSEISASGSISSDGGASITAKGYCWATTTNPTTSNSHTSDGTGTASWTSSITGLNGTTTYYARAYATNSAGTSYGSNLTINTALYSTAYAELNTVRIGTSNQDLDVTYYSTNPEASNKSVKVRIQNVSKSSGWIEGSLFTSYSNEYRISRSGTISMGVTNAEGDSFDIQYSTDGGSTWTANISVPNSKTIPY